MVSCVHKVVVYVDGRGGRLINMGSLHCFPVQFSGELTYTVVQCAYTEVVYVEGGAPLVNMGL